MGKKIREQCSKPWKVKASTIHNQGVFASRKVDKGEDIIQYLGERISHEEADQRGLEREAMVHGSDEAAVYLFTLDENWVLDGNDENNPARLINHSCDPNCEAVIYGEGDEAEIWLVAKTEIEKGAELSFDYGFDLENYEGHPCLCGAKKCVGYIVGEDYRAKLKKLLKQRKEAGEIRDPGKKTRKKKRKKR